MVDKEDAAPAAGTDEAAERDVVKPAAGGQDAADHTDLHPGPQSDPRPISLVGPRPSAAQAEGGPSFLERTDPELRLDASPSQADAAAAPHTRAPSARPPRRHGERDPALGRYIDSLNLSELDLSQVDLPGPKPRSLATLLVCGAAALAGAITLLVLPSTAAYQLHTSGEVLFWLCAACELGVLTLGYRHLDAWRAPASLALRAPTGLADWAHNTGAALQQFETLLLRWRRPLMGLGIVGLAATIVFVLPHEPEWQGGTYSTTWFLAVIVAMSCGILVGRFILAQAEASPLAHDLKPWVLPSWFRWVTLSMLVLGGLTASFGNAWFGLGGTGPSSEFSLAGLGLVVGIGGAIWLARRFDELETKWLAQRRSEAENKAEKRPFEA